MALKVHIEPWDEHPTGEESDVNGVRGECLFPEEAVQRRQFGIC